MQSAECGSVVSGAGCVRWVLARGALTHQHALAGRDSRFSKRGVVSQRELEVVYTEEAWRE